MRGYLFALKLLVLIGGAAAGFWAGYRWQGAELVRIRSEWERERAETRALLDRERARQAQVSERVVTKYLARAAQVREVTKEVIREVPVAVPPEADAGCVVPCGAVRVCDAAATCGAPTPEAPCSPDGAPSPVALSQLVLWAVTVEGQYCEVAARLEALQEWAREQSEH